MAERVVICASEATVVRDDRNPTPHKVSGCVVGEPVERDGRTYLRGWTFVTEVRTEHERARWPRNEAPNPCPYCRRSNP